MQSSVNGRVYVVTILVRNKKFMVSELGSMQGLESIIDRKHEWKTLIRQYRIMKIPITYKMFPSFSITRLSALNQTPNNVKLSEEILLHISSPMLKVTNLFIFSANCI